MDRWTPRPVLDVAGAALGQVQVRQGLPMTWDLRLGDCLADGLASLADNGVDIVLTDPPYSPYVQARCRTSKGSGEAPSREVDLGFAPMTPYARAQTARHVARIVRRWVLVFCDVESVHLWREALEGFRLRFVRTCFWRRTNPAPQFTGDRPGAALDAIVVCHAPGAMRWNGGGKAGFYEYPVVHGAARVHETQKPLALMMDLVRDFTDPGDRVLDPFAGSGTTGVACRLLGRHFIGWEKDEKHHAIALSRLRAADEQRVDIDADQLGLFAVAPK